MREKSQEPRTEPAGTPAFSVQRLPTGPASITEASRITCSICTRIKEAFMKWNSIEGLHWETYVEVHVIVPEKLREM